MTLILRILVFSLAGAACGLVARAWISRLQLRRDLPHGLSRRGEWLLAGATAVSGGVLGGLTTGSAYPACGLLLLCICGAVTVMDWTSRIIPNQTVLALLGLKLLTALPAFARVPGFPPFQPLQSLIGLGACFLLFCLPGFFGRHVGAGDIKLAAAMGFLLGLNHALLAVIIMGLLVVGYSLVQNRMPMLKFLKTNIPMGPFITVGMFTAYAGAPLLL